MKKAVDNKCPRCTLDVPAPGLAGLYPGALSRTDNETEICSGCGLIEAYEQFKGVLTNQSEWLAA